MGEGEIEYKQRTYRDHRDMILKYSGCKKFDRSAVELLVAQLTPMVRSHSRPKLMFQQACDILIKHKVGIPSYYALYTVISRQIKQHQEELNQTIRNALTKEQKALLDTLLSKEDGNRYRLTLLKRFSHSTRPSKIKSNIEDLKLLRILFETVEPLVKSLQLTNEGMKYYAYAAIKFRIFQVLERSDTERYLYLLAFISHQYYTLQDLLIDVLIPSVAGAENHTNKKQQENMFLLRKARSQTIESVISSFLTDKQLIKGVKSILESKELPANEKVRSLQMLFEGNNKQDEDLESKATQLQKENKRILKDEDYYETLETQSLKLQNRVSEIVKRISFNEDESNNHIIAAVRFFKKKDGNIGNSAPVDFLEPEEQNVLFDDQKKLRVSLYKIMLFSHIAMQMKSGGLNLRYSYKYRSFDEYLISKAKWHSDKELLLEQSGLV